MPIFIMVLAGIALILAFILTFRMGRKLLLAIAALGGIAVVVIMALTMLGQADATRQASKAAQGAAEAATRASTGQSLITILLIVMGIAQLVTLTGAAYLYIRWKIADQYARGSKDQGDSGKWVSGPNAYWGKKNKSQQPPALPPGYYPPYQPPVVYQPEKEPESRDDFGWLYEDWDDDLW
jgi:hypothetical protein